MHFWWPPRVDDIFEYDWGSSGTTIMHVDDVLSPRRRMEHGYVFSATVLEDYGGAHDMRLILGNTIILTYLELTKIGTLTLLSRRAKRTYVMFR